MDKRIIGFLPSAAFYILALAAQVSGYTSSTVALVLAGVATVMLLVPACHHSIRWHRTRKSGGRNGLDSWYFIGPCLAVAMIAIAGAAYGFGLQRAEEKPPGTQTSSAGEQFLRDAVLAVWSDHPTELLVFVGTPTLTTERLRVLVDYSIYRSGWMSPVRFAIGEIKEPVKGQRVKVPLVHTGSKPNGGAEDLWWGSSDQASANPVTNNPVYGPEPVSLTRGRLVIVGPSNKEQYVYFQIARAPNDTNGHPKFMVLQGRAIDDWVSSWEKDN